LSGNFKVTFVNDRHVQSFHAQLSSAGLHQLHWQWRRVTMTTWLHEELLISEFLGLRGPYHTL